MSGGLTVNDDVRPANGTYAVQDIYVRGGLRILDNTSDVSAIPTGNSNLRIGQRAYVVATGIEYQLSSLTPGGGFTNGTWVVYSAPTNAGSWTGVDTVATSNISLSGGGTLHSLVLVTGMRVLVVGQTLPAQNGIYVVNTAGAWTRATDADSSGEFALGKLVAVTNASSDLINTIWCCSAAPTTLGTDPITFGENAAAGSTFNPHAPGPLGDSTPNAVYAAEFTRAPQVVSTNTTMDNFDTWLIDTSGGTFTLKFPLPVNGRCRLLKDKGLALATTGFTLDGNGNNFEHPFSLASVSTALIGGGGGSGAGNGWASEWMWSSSANKWLRIE